MSVVVCEHAGQLSIRHEVFKEQLLFAVSLDTNWVSSYFIRYKRCV